MKRFVPFLFLFLLVAGCAAPAESEASYRQVSMDEAIAMMEEKNNYIILDVRTPEEFAEKHIPDAINIPNETIGTEEIPELPDKEQLILVYCRSGNRSNEVHLSDFTGKPIVLNFWASWCGPCKMEMPDFDDAYAELGEDVHFLMVNMTSGRETLESATSFIEEQGYSFPVCYDTDADAAMTYGVYSLPTTLFIDAEGYGIAQATGAINAETLQRGIDMISPKK